MSVYAMRKQLKVSMAHRIFRDGAPTPLHGHSLSIVIFLESESLNDDGMVAGFDDVEEAIKVKLDNTTVLWNDDPLANILQDQTQITLLPYNPTTENIARWIGEQVKTAVRVVVEERFGNESSWDREDSVLDDDICDINIEEDN